MSIQPLPPIEFLNEALEIDLESPTCLRWKVRPKEHFTTVRGFKIFNTRDAGQCAGFFNKYRCGQIRLSVKINQRSYPAHRVIYALATGRDPFPLEVDHKDRNPQNNHPENLRVATRSENASNKNIQLNNTSGRRGVTWCKRTSKWMAQIGKDKKTLFLGRFDSIEEAAAARLSAEKKIHGRFSPQHKEDLTNLPLGNSIPIDYERGAL
jgi:hypothetical protein